MDPYKFNSWIRILISLCSLGAYILISLMLPLFVGKSNFETMYGIHFVAPYNKGKYITWNKFESQICSSKRAYAIPKKANHFQENTAAMLCEPVFFLKNYLLIVFIITIINMFLVKGVLIYTHFKEHPETFAIKYVKYCNKLIIFIMCLTIINFMLFTFPFFFFNYHNEFGKTTFAYPGYYILMGDFFSHFIIILFIKRDKTILKCVCELEVLPWERKQKPTFRNAVFNDTLISPAEITNYLHNMFHEDNINEDQLKNLFGTNNYEDIYYMIVNNIKMNN
ncbi:conserved Plasmodium protein, unknown function [Plasmodium berghei]|uniref:Uncharacterized protein n=2 Tax=Plasmodium berghei TaxID=5821 RepID=A0A509AKK8_PLABA|nr:conserved Plasmodium protein, unknown function [Plasmodium berghei ANKA]CXI32589.1 conserved Plasmodium protein, unknown function [Plasmodium berghei]SCM21151.1 conserved Plasmodium protein, unknown function [Plasmodium berghei]SCN24492.1 conserved Plasmodium protein, unknown function [Plasmodium berghei]SCO59674.1 conserved Plasmodium protein, unknown function [Plasmodium berghei]SCO60862.1 conserved Plasmodium protein, unknown function [Plasmodium berghei]|eukprot:XP_034421145.1 conserved Plasmodium protein, unknown function [Plasmodium berghei ANKA]